MTHGHVGPLLGDPILDSVLDVGLFAWLFHNPVGSRARFSVSGPFQKLTHLTENQGRLVVPSPF